jgi:hypothetical protein
MDAILTGAALFPRTSSKVYQKNMVYADKAERSASLGENAKLLNDTELAVHTGPLHLLLADGKLASQ